MRINRYQNFSGMKERDILDLFNAEVIECDDYYELYYTDTEAFWFFDGDDENLKIDEIKEFLTYLVSDSFKNHCLVEKLKDKRILIFITESKYPNYTFYGVYKLDSPYTEGSGTGVVVEAYVPLKFRLIRDFYEVIQNSI